MYDTLLNTIEERMHSYGESLQAPCPTECLKNLRLRAKLELGCDIPDQYGSFLTKANGLDWNGVVVYACERTPIVGYSDRFIDGFVEANLDFRDHEPMKDYLVFADDGVALFTYHITESKYEVITRVGLSLLESFNAFDDLLTNTLSGHM
jgi:hypothetical protein